MEGESTSSTFEVGDVLFGKLRPYLAKVWGGGVSRKIDNRAFGHAAAGCRRAVPALCFIEPQHSSTQWMPLPLVRRCHERIGTLLGYANPSTGLHVQRRIARFLDRQTASIDALVCAKQRQLDLISEKRKAMIAAAVTRGLDPGAPMRDSGVPWLGAVPAHWQIERARWLFRERDVRSETGEEEMLTVSHLTGVTPRSEKDVNMFEAETNEGYKVCLPGDLVINTLWAWMGAMGVAPMKGIVSPAYNVYEAGPRLESSYVDLLVRLPVFAREVTRYSKGVWSSRLRLYPEGFFETYLPVPPLEEQRAVVVHIAREIAKLNGFRDATGRTIELLKETSLCAHRGSRHRADRHRRSSVIVTRLKLANVRATSAL